MLGSHFKVNEGLTVVKDRFVSPSPFIGKVLSPNETIFGNRAFKGVIKVR